MKVLHVISHMSLSYGGMALACKEIAENQVKSGVDCTLITSNLDFPAGKLKKELLKPIIENGVKVIYVPIFFKPLVFSFQIMKILKSEIKNADIVHIHGLYRFPQTFSSWYARKIGKPYIISPHGSLDPVVYNNKDRYFLRSLYQKIFELKNINKATKIHFTAFEEKSLTNNLIPSSKGVIIPNGINTEEYENLPSEGFFKSRFNIDDNLFKILFLGRITWKKGLDILISSIKIIKENIPNVVLLVVGPDNEGYKIKLLKIIKELNLSKQIKFIGLVDREDVKKSFVDSDIFVLPSYSENFGLTIVESMACSFPVIISYNVNIYNEIEENNLGYVINCTASEIANSIFNYYQKTVSDKNKIKRHIREYSINNYGWDKCVDKFIRLYNNSIADPNG